MRKCNPSRKVTIELSVKDLEIVVHVMRDCLEGLWGEWMVSGEAREMGISRAKNDHACYVMQTLAAALYDARLSR